MHHMQHCRQHSTSLANFCAAGPPAAASLSASFWSFAMMARMVLMMAMIKLPNAAVPVWYRKVVEMAVKTVAELMVDLSLAKYQNATDIAVTNCPTAMMNSEVQNQQKIKYQYAFCWFSEYT